MTRDIPIVLSPISETIPTMLCKSFSYKLALSCCMTHLYFRITSGYFQQPSLTPLYKNMTTNPSNVDRKDQAPPGLTALN